MKTTLSARPIHTQAKDAWIVFVQDQHPLLPDVNELETLRHYIKKTGFSGDYAKTLVFPTFGSVQADQIILTGLGNSADFSTERLERAAAASMRAARKSGIRTLAIPIVSGLRNIPETSFIHTVARGAAWGTYHFDTFKTDPKKPTGEPSLTFAGPCKEIAACRHALTEATLESRALLSTADLANLPGNEATPRKIADWAKSMAAETGLDFSILNKADLKKKKCGAILAVAAGSAQDANIITLRYKGADPSAKPVVLIGKTVTFDSGGISLKPGKNMSWMLYDKCGGMAVLAAMQMVALLKPSIPVIGMLAVAENMPGGSATRPGDIITSHAGKTIEILNTDAEGRLLLADALSLAKAHQPSAIVDLATLTGAVIIALGHTASAIIGNNRPFTQTLIDAGTAAGERFWELPLWPEHMDDMKGTFADLQNIAKSGTAGTITAAAFLANFVPENVPWAHLDIAGTAWEESAKDWADPGATLFGARTLIEWIKRL